MLILYNLKIRILKVLIPYLVKYNALNFLCLIFLMSLSSIKKIKPNKKKYKILVLSKSGGIDDLIESQKKYNKNTLFLSCPREFFHFLCKSVMKIDKLNDKEFISKKLKSKRRQYYNFLNEFLIVLKKNYKFNAFIGFNFNYMPEIELHEACKNLKIPFLLLYKESVGTEVQNKFRIFFLKKINQKFQGYKIAVYSTVWHK